MQIKSSYRHIAFHDLISSAVSQLFLKNKDFREKIYLKLNLFGLPLQFLS